MLICGSWSLSGEAPGSLKVCDMTRLRLCIFFNLSKHNCDLRRKCAASIISKQPPPGKTAASSTAVRRTANAENTTSFSSSLTVSEGALSKRVTTGDHVLSPTTGERSRYLEKKFNYRRDFLVSSWQDINLFCATILSWTLPTFPSTDKCTASSERELIIFALKEVPSSKTSQRYERKQKTP